MRFMTVALTVLIMTLTLCSCSNNICEPSSETDEFTLQTIQETAVETDAVAETIISDLPAPFRFDVSADFNKASISWNTIVRASGYAVYRYDADSRKYEKYKETSKNKITVTGLESGTLYKFKVSAVEVIDGEKVEGELSETVSVSTRERFTDVYFALPYQYYSLSEEWQEKYISLRQDIFDHKNKVTLRWGSCKDEEAFINDLAICTATIKSHDPLVSAVFSSDTVKSEAPGYCTFDVDYVFTADEHIKNLKMVEQISQGVAESVKYFDDYDKILYIHDYIVNNCDYNDESEINHTAYGCLVNGSACCEGYSKAFACICDKAGLELTYVYGDSLDLDDDSTHAWNKVHYDNNWYNIDVTWDDPDNIYFNNVLKYKYFMISDEEFAKTHVELGIPDNRIIYPSATDSSLNYYTAEGLVVENKDDMDDFVYNLISGAVRNGDKSVIFFVPDDEIYAWAINHLSENSHKVLKDIIARVMSEGDWNLTNCCTYICWEDNTIWFPIFYKNTSLSDYFTEDMLAEKLPLIVPQEDIIAFEENGIK